jgi:hypothetical protein
MTASINAAAANAHQPHREPRLRQGLERVKGPHVAALLLQVGDAAETSSREDARVGGVGALQPVVGLAHREVERELLVQIAVETAAPDDGEQAMPDGRQCHMSAGSPGPRLTPSA